MFRYRVNGLTVGMPDPVFGLSAASPVTELDTELVWMGWRESRQMPSVRDAGWISVAFPGNRGRSQGAELWHRDFAGETRYLFRVSGAHAAEFLITSNGRRVEVTWTNPVVDRTHLVRLMLGPVLGLILRITRRLPLHAGAAATNGRAVAVLGPSGSGKSTLIASLLEHDCTLLADDLIHVEEKGGAPVLGSGPAGLQLWPGSLEAMDRRTGDFPPAYLYSAKRAVAVAAVSPSESVPLAALFLLAPRRAVSGSLHQLIPSEALTLLLGQLYPPFLPVGSEEHRSLFPRLLRLIAQVPVYRVERSDGFGGLPALSRRIIDVAAAHAG